MVGSKDVLATEDVHLGTSKTYLWPLTKESANEDFHRNHGRGKFTGHEESVGLELNEYNCRSKLTKNSLEDS